MTIKPSRIALKEYCTQYLRLLLGSSSLLLSVEHMLQCGSDMATF